MKRIMLFLCTLLLFIGTHDVAVATLTQMSAYGDVVVYDGGQYWHYDLGYARNMVYSEQMSAIDDLNVIDYYGLNSWHLASMAEYSNLLNAMADESCPCLFFQPTIMSLDPVSKHYTGIIDVLSEIHITTPGGGGSGTTYSYHAVATIGVYGAHTSATHPIVYPPPDIPGDRDDIVETPFVGAWIAATGDPRWPGGPPDPPAVPEPATMLLLGSGLVGLAGFGRKKFKK